MSVFVSLSVTNHTSIKTADRIELVFSTEASFELSYGKLGPLSVWSVSKLISAKDSQLQQRFSNFFDHGPLFSSSIVGGPPHFRVATFALLQSGTGVRPFPPSAPFPLPFPSFPFPIPCPLLPLRSRQSPPIAATGSGGALKLPQRVRAEPGRQTHSDAFFGLNLRLFEYLMQLF